MSGFVLVFAIFIGLAVVFSVFLHNYMEQQRREQLQAVALRIGLAYSAEEEPSLWERVAGLALFAKGRRRRIYNVLHRQIHDIDATLFDYQYTKMQGKNQRTYRHTVALFETDRLRLPQFALHPQYFYHQIANALGFGDIDFEGHPVFSESYRLRGTDEESIRRLFDEEALLYFTRHPGLHTEGRGRRLILYQEGRRVDPAKLEAFLQQGLDVLDVFMEKEGALGNLALLGIEFEDARDDQAGTEGEE